jgi:hypothetical protein
MGRTTIHTPVASVRQRRTRELYTKRRLVLPVHCQGREGEGRGESDVEGEAQWSYQSHVSTPFSSRTRTALTMYSKPFEILNAQKGVKKSPQQEWVDSIKNAADNEKDTVVRDALLRITEYDNCPRKEKPFINFVKNSLRLPESIVTKAWKALEVIKSQIQQERAKEQEEKKRESEAKAAAKAAADKEAKESKKRKREEAKGVSPGEGSPSKKSKSDESELAFDWGSRITAVMGAAEGGVMKIKELRKAVLKLYKAADTTASEDGDHDKAYFKELFKGHLDTVVSSGSLSLEGKKVLLAV